MIFDTSREQPVCTEVSRIADARGVLTKMVADGAATLPDLGVPPRQILHSGTARRHTLRGLHVQTAPHTEAKRIYCLTGHMFWVLVDLRKQSASFGRWQGFDLTRDGSNALAAPAGFGHGCLSLTDDVNLVILSDQDYVPAHGIGIAWNDPEIGIDWPLEGEPALLSSEHDANPSFAEFRARIGGL